MLAQHIKAVTKSVFLLVLATMVFFTSSVARADSSTPLRNADVYSITNNSPFYDPDDDQQCSATGIASTPIAGDIRALAQQILANPNVSYDYGPSGPTGTQFKRLADGQKAQTDDGRQVDVVQPIILVTILHIAQSHKVNISALTDGSSHTSPTNPHGSGRGLDINILDGTHTNGTDAIASTIVNSAVEVLPNKSRFGLGANGGVRYATKQINGKTFYSFIDNPNHVHIDVSGVSQADLDASVQAAGSGVSTQPVATGCCPLKNSDATQLSGNSPGEQVFNFFIAHGLSNDSAAAATGNLEVESGFRSDIWGGGGGNYYGLAQWDRIDRYPKLVQSAGSAENASKLNYQLDFVWKELNNGYTSTLTNLKGTSSVQDKAIFWGRHYEGAVNKDGSLQSEALRVANAIKWSVKSGGAPAGGGQTISAIGGGCGEAATAGKYANPFHSTDGLIASRIDEGVDYASTKPVPLYAIGNGTVTLATSKSTFYTTKGGHSDWITYQLTDGPAAGKYIYIAEACPPKIKTGDKVTTATVLCDVLPDSMEMGWAPDGTSQYAAAYYDYRGHNGYETAYGVNFNQLLVKLGAPSGHLDAGSDPSGQVLGTLPIDWPKW